MDDILFCPMCNNKLRNVNMNRYLLYPTGKRADYVERRCTTGHGHVVIFWTDKATSQVDFMCATLCPTFERVIETDFVNNRSKIICKSNGAYQSIDIDRLLVPDFPDFIEIQQIVDLFVAMS